LRQQLGPQYGRLLELGNNWEQQLWARSGRLFELGNNWEQQLWARSGRLFEGKIMGLFWTIGNINYGCEAENKYGREAAAFLNIKRSLYLTSNLEQLRSQRSGRIGHLLRTTTTVAKRPPFNWINGNNYGREAAAFLN
jgi:hypothetical protein